ncbi:hypothetical protein AGABI1DRAFT_36986 [Agaricus bisporus var. burnettii JB137-S8]|uniref:J domain-containing protein n=1 Tax=Agaricus bisporus var. burnettii (strain JB137-S8 / ATCC MYA-4627 / FGSC 10392) TaxID=597362 RepID=K5WYM5_AGABU|nr:uncharacterized protein AGABI1DRAFT_36986 [Agaricus bisporus var. burnettii JB137-S8]EKM80581.1 hypothetical protein AGABI1DRAFT_36986 [Agaricus bisporus var. burnettii JB137-S8]
MQKFLSLSCYRFRTTGLLARGHATSSRTAPNSYPYPTIKNPTPHQIFHLPQSATENDIKARYFDLVRIYHPDKASSSIHPDIAHERFQAITTAYDILRGKKASGFSGHSNPQDLSYQTTAAYRAARKRRQELYSSGAVDHRWKDRIFIGLVLAVSIVCILVCKDSPPIRLLVYFCYNHIPHEKKPFQT